ncbi:MAG: carbamoyltransferase HypF [Gemmatales bacterium]|nr:carbamoyltransferase HypF [Gemmatales bacterium]MDW8386368.1 carbamoyltransferase HypF [Gemmatales bacterium]
MERHRYEVEGIVQGIGFRPMVACLANRLGLTGWVANTTRGAVIEVQGNTDSLTAFGRTLRQELARFVSHRRLCFPRGNGDVFKVPTVSSESGFVIRGSVEDGTPTPCLIPDLAPCPDCVRELLDPSDRRFRYPFISCTACGPRFSILKKLPFDRENTTMSAFPLCPACAKEYADPTNRRFHAQTIACPACGPRLSLRDGRGKTLARDDDALRRAEEALLDGRIVALKGVGGFQLLVDARKEEAVQRLRKRKGREAKPFALLVRDLDQARRWCQGAEAEWQALSSPRTPIVLLRRRGTRGLTPAARQEVTHGLTPAARKDESLGLTSAARPAKTACDSDIAMSIAPGLPWLGLMLPASPLHLLLTHDLGIPLVATSGNRSEEPLCIADAEAFERLGDIADLFLTHDRPIARPLDDSVVQVVDGRPMTLRRARGYVPEPVCSGIVEATGQLTLTARRQDSSSSITASGGRQSPGAAPASGGRQSPGASQTTNGPILALGGHLKNTIALTVGDTIVLSQHLGDLDTLAARNHFDRAIRDFLDLFQIEPVAVICDAHPDYASTLWAEEQAATRGVSVFHVQHHQAHVWACLVEQGESGPALGVAWDGTGYGDDGTIWGGEFFLVEGHGCRRVGSLLPFPLLGGDAAVRQPRRSALGVLWTALGEQAWRRNDLPSVRSFSDSERSTMSALLRRKVGVVMTSSMGRLFDAVASLLDLCHVSRYEGEAAMRVQAAAGSVEAVRDAEPYSFAVADDGVIDWRPMVHGLLVDHRRPDLAAARFHATLAEMIAAMAKRTNQQTVALGGGCFQNRLLVEVIAARLRNDGRRVLWPCEVPPNDGGLSLGQILAAVLRGSLAEVEPCVLPCQAES